MSDDRYGCNKQYVMILLKYQAGEKKCPAYKEKGGYIWSAHCQRTTFLFFSVGKEVRNPGSQHFFMDM